MTHDPVYKRLRELSWRRPLTESEQAELRELLSPHPDALAEWETEAELNGLLRQLPAAPVPSNFTARVLQSVEHEAAAERRSVFRWTWHWRIWLPRTAAAVVVVGLGLFAHHRHVVNERITAIGIVAGLPEVEPEVLENFEAIRHLSQTPRPDEELLALLQ